MTETKLEVSPIYAAPIAIVSSTRRDYAEHAVLVRSAPESYCAWMQTANFDDRAYSYKLNGLDIAANSVNEIVPLAQEKNTNPITPYIEQISSLKRQATKMNISVPNNTASRDNQ